MLLGLLLASPASERPGVRCVLVLPSGVEPFADAPEKLDRTVRDVQWWYSCQMEAYGYGPKTFDYEKDARGHLVVNVARLPPDAPTESVALREATVKAAETVLGDAKARRGTVMLMVYNGYVWTDRERYAMATMGYGQPGRWAHLTAWQYNAVNANGWRDVTPVPKLPLDNPYFSPLATRVLQAFSGDGVKTVAERTSAGYGVFAHEMGHAFGLLHPDRKLPLTPGDLMASRFWHMRGNFLEDLPRDWCCLSPGEAAVLDKNPIFQPREVAPPSTGVSRRVGMRGAVSVAQ